MFSGSLKMLFIDQPKAPRAPSDPLSGCCGAPGKDHSKKACQMDRGILAPLGAAHP